ncbi:unnamed protein product [Rotaria sp. Silwood1]|nr:unnamed protein product [Rotaria sp. Silwood1]
MNYDKMIAKIVDLINQVSLYGKDSVRVQYLKHLQELILLEDPSLLDNFLEYLIFKQIKVDNEYDPEVIVKVIDSLRLLLYDDNVLVQKKLIVSMITIYRLTLKCLSKSRLVDENVRCMSESINNMNIHIIAMLDSDNDGVRTVAIQFIEMLALVLSQLNLPPTLVDSQVSSVRKIIKLKLLSLLKHPASFDFQPQITRLLTDLGATQAELLKHLPKVSSESKRKLSLTNTTYTPIAAAGTLAQIKHLTRLLGAQLTAVGYGKDNELMRSEQHVKPPIDNDIEEGKPI